MNETALRPLIQALTQAEEFVLTAHTTPDGDSLGSLLGLDLALRALGKRTVAYVESVTETYRFLPGAANLRLWTDAPVEPPRVLVTLDCATPERLGPGQAFLAGAGLVINIDHHPGNPEYGAINYIDPGAAAAGEQVYLLLKAMGAAITPPIATCLYTAIASDTGSFRYENTTPRTHQLAGELLAAGADLAAINQYLYESRNFAQTRLLGLVLSTLTLSPGGKVAWAFLTEAMRAEAGVEQVESEGIIGFVRSVAGVEAALLFKERAAGEVWVSLRSRGTVDVNALATTFGGGGHTRAAGCTVYGELSAASQPVIDAARRLVND